jgi:hypothetical protein
MGTLIGERWLLEKNPKIRNAFIAVAGILSLAALIDAIEHTRYEKDRADFEHVYDRVSSLPHVNQ